MADNVGSLAPSKSADNARVALSNDNDYDYEDTDSVREGDTKTCKFCYGTESDGSEWLHPCKCSGSLMWVHGNCFDLWLTSAPPAQQIRCLMCNYSYKKHLVLLPPSEWRLPNVKITAFQFFEIALDFYSTTRLYKGFMNTFSGKRTIVMQLAHILFYRMFILTSSRVEYYESIGRQLLKSICQQTVANYGEEDADQSLFSMSKGFSREIEDLVRF
ncbi:hypothetical protein PRIPAC_90687 [Pristionchus pacificus]|uniref:RING-CH-type domain-containing protein n=1 Tax=Pristionchus pacificus TaxID=54126 RepID=A0A2A6B614_PRIPA|nr:hypothetical protein PRIPAC_90687 [Pristionchus pacificus]|eukprot:PDM61312.1 hypothetical protein PRIPAC_50754 [Pristionchus pacificus]